MRLATVAAKYFDSKKVRSSPGFNEIKKFSDHLPSVTQFILTGVKPMDGYANKKDKIYYLPFKYCSFEFPIPTPAIDANGDMSGWRRNTKFSSPMFIGQYYIENDDLSISHLYLIGDIHDYTIDQYLKNPFAYPANVISHLTEFKSYEHLNSFACHRTILAYLHDKNVSYGLTSRHIKFKRSGVSPDFVKRIVVLGDKKTINETKSVMGANIDWQHTWSVMGHWRRIDQNMVGKTREGEYSVVGQTWVKDHIRGEGEFIKKDRIKKPLNNHVPSAQKEVTI
jgi:hypothetical protein